MSPIAKIKLKMFILGISFDLITCGIIALIAVLNNRLIETLFFYIAWITFRATYPKAYHITKFSLPIMNLFGCMICSIGIFFIAMRNMLPISISLFSSVILGMFIVYLLYKLKDYEDLKAKQIDTLNKLYALSEDELRDYARSNGLNEVMVDTLIMRIKYNYRWCEIRKARNYSRHAIDYHKKIIETKLNIKI